MAAAGTVLASLSQDQTFHIAQGGGKTVDTIESPLTTFHVAQGYQEPVSTDNLPKIGRPEQTQAADILPFNRALKETDSPTSVVASQSVVDPQSQSIIRAHFATTILSELSGLQQHSGQPGAASHANKLFRIIRQYRDLSPAEPYVEILMALYDSMAFENRWVEYKQPHYELASKILRAYAGQKLDNSKVRKAILKLQKAGFDILPFGGNGDETFLDEEKDREHATKAS